MRELGRQIDALMLGDDMLIKEPSADELERESDLPKDVLELASSMLNCEFAYLTPCA